MPRQCEGSILYARAPLAAIFIGEAARVLQATDRLIRPWPDVGQVYGKAGRATSATDPAPASMIATVRSPTATGPVARW
jgi:Cu(I)/Ag(I) efflux system membrane protein CusA/SilA